MFRLINILNTLSINKTYPSGMEEKLSLNTYIYTPKRFHWIHCKTQIGLTLFDSISTCWPSKKIRTISTSSEPKPVLIYNNPDEHKGLIIQQNKNKSGVYRWVNKDSGKCYIGSSSMLNDRFRRYFNHSYLSSSKRGESLICKALLKYGYGGFILEILEYCPSSIVLTREQFFIDKFNPEYNILKVAGTSLGYKHNEASLKLMSIASKKRNESEEVLKLKKEVMLGRKLSKDQLEKMAKNNLFRVAIILTNTETEKREEFTSMAQAAIFLGIHETTVKRYLINNKPYNGYIITKAASGLESSSSLTNKNQGILLTNSAASQGITKEFSSMKDACQFLGISHKRLLNYLKNNDNLSTDGQVNTIKGFIVTKLDLAKNNSKVIEVTNIHTNEVTKYSSIRLASETLGIAQASISTYLNRKRTKPFKGLYLFKLI